MIILYKSAATAMQNIVAKNSTTKSGFTNTSTTRTIELNGKKYEGRILKASRT